MSKSERFVIWHEKTGNPVADNRNRVANSHMSRNVRRDMRILGSRNRKRKKFVTKAERINYIELVVAVMKELSQKGTP